MENSIQVMRRRDLGDGVVEIEHSDGIDRWLVVKKMLDASKISLQVMLTISDLLLSFSKQFF